MCDHTCAALYAGFRVGEKKGIAVELRDVTFIDLSNIKLLVHDVYTNLCFTNGHLLMMDFNTVVISSVYLVVMLQTYALLLLLKIHQQTYFFLYVFRFLFFASQ